MARVIGNSVEQGGRGHLRALRPLVLWFCLAASLLTWDVYRKVAAKTAISFRLLVDGAAPDNSPAVKLNGVVVRSGGRISIGKKTLLIDVPDLDPYERK